MTILTKNQKKVYIATKIKLSGYDGPVDVVAEVRHDDECGNGHNSFAITGTVYKPGCRSDRNTYACGCMHEEITEAFPELAPFIKWHLCNTDGPMHYVANSLYHARDRDYPDVAIGAPVGFTTRLAFRGIFFTFAEHEPGFWDYLDNVGDFDMVEVVTVPYDGTDDYPYSDHYSLTGFIKDDEPKQWYRAPFKSFREADEFLLTLRDNAFYYTQTANKWCQACTPNLDAARSSAIWPEAELSDFTEENLVARLQALLEAFQHDVESLGLVF